MSNKYKIFVPSSAKKSLSKIPLPWKERLAKAIDLLEENPYMGEKMTGQLSNCRKIRIWPYRIVYQISKKEGFIKILEIEHRGNVSYG